jgi:uncharacterized protein (UPF0548 family)
VVGAVAVGLHGELAHRDVGVRVHEQQRHPRAVVEAAAVILLDGPEPALLQELFRLLGQIGRAGCRILQLDGSE